MAHEIHEDDISKRIFTQALESAKDACDGSIMILSAKLGMRSTCRSWVEGHMPPYKKMQEMYPKLLKIAGEKNGNGK